MRDGREEEIIAFLTEAAAGGGDGWRTSKEVADHLGMSTEAARARLEVLAGDHRIDHGKNGGALIWHTLTDRVPVPRYVRPPTFLGYGKKRRKAKSSA